MTDTKSIPGNRDGKFLDRLIPSLFAAALAVAVALGGQYAGFWAASKAADIQTASAINRLSADVAGVGGAVPDRLSFVRQHRGRPERHIGRRSRHRLDLQRNA